MANGEDLSPSTFTEERNRYTIRLGYTSGPAPTPQITAAWRTRLWLAGRWECRDRRLSRG
jgi:hypothetical protein